MGRRQKEAWQTPDGRDTVRGFLLNFRAGALRAYQQAVRAQALDIEIRGDNQAAYWRGVVRACDWLLSFVTPRGAHGSDRVQRTGTET